jgi:hypothetical protein
MTTLSSVRPAAYNGGDGHRTLPMLTGLLRLSLPAVLVGAVCLPAQADIYTWVDAAGTINVSNLAPPDGARVTSVIHASAPPIAAADQAARDAARDAQVRTLAERVVQLEDAVESAQRQAPPPVVYAPPPPMVQYITDVQAPSVQYVVNAAPPASNGCDSTWMDCGPGWMPVFYPAAFVVLRPPFFSRPRPSPGGRHLAVQQPPMPAPFASLRRG